MAMFSAVRLFDTFSTPRLDVAVATSTELAPALIVPVRLTVPAEMVVVPVYVLTPDNVSVPAPVLVRLNAPDTAEATLAVPTTSKLPLAPRARLSVPAPPPTFSVAPDATYSKSAAAEPAVAFASVFREIVLVLPVRPFWTLSVCVASKSFNVPNASVPAAVLYENTVGLYVTLVNVTSVVVVGSTPVE